MASPDYVVFVIFSGLRDESILVVFGWGKQKQLLATPGSYVNLITPLCECLFFVNEWGWLWRPALGIMRSLREVPSVPSQVRTYPKP